jgi:hypothetical protein
VRLEERRLSGSFYAGTDNKWSLISCDFAFDEVNRNLSTVSGASAHEWAKLQTEIAFLEDELTFDRPVVFEPAKDRPVLFTAAAGAMFC